MDNHEFVKDSHQVNPSKFIDKNNGNRDPIFIPGIVDVNDEQQPISDGTVRMKRQISLIGGISVIVGTMIGSGIFITPTNLLKRTDSAATSLIIWAGCGFLTTLCALSYCELGTSVPRSGGEHAYLMAAFGSLHKFWGQIPAFLFAWIMATLLKPSSLAILSLAVGRYVLLPFVRNSTICEWWTDQFDYQMGQKFLAILCILTVTGINAFSAKATERLLIVLTFAKLSASAIVIGIGIYNLAHGEFGGFPTDGFDKSDNITFGRVAIAFYSGLWAFSGWSNLNYLTEELVNPTRNLPLAIIIAVPMVTCIYVFMNVSYLTMMSKDELLASTAVGIDVGEKYLGDAKLLMPILVALSVFAAASGSALTAARISYVAARDSHLPAILSYVHVNRLTPIVSLTFNAIFATIMVIFNDITELIDTFSFTAWFITALVMVTFFVLRIREPNIKRPIKIPLIIPAVAFIMSCYLVVAPILDNPGAQYLYPLIYCVVGLIFYFFFVYKKVELKFMEKITIAIQCIALSAPSPYKED